ncbi:MAG: hypothetical protein GC168_02235 [Candidatus Hydrogenedens sp.]|nr:hypothetical protein [Candidatus Hydrogenedens sp.]
MQSSNHLRLITRKPEKAQSNLQIKLEGTTAIIDRLLLVDRQAPWKATGPTDGTDTGTGTGTGTGGLEI